MSPRGAFIVVEGLDRSGKSTQCANILRKLVENTRDVKLMKFPDRTTAIGLMIDSYLRSKSELDDHAIHLLFSANRWELAASIERDLTAGKIILCDRYAYSGCAFTAAKGLPFEWCRSPDIGLPEPDIVLFLDVSPEVAKTRGGYGDERYENELMQRNVRQIFKDIGASVGQKWVTIDANQTLEEVESKIIDTIEPVLTGALGPIGKLWVA